jgi:polyhydroxyalkanoate synthesis regulator phasin
MEKKLLIVTTLLIGILATPAIAMVWWGDGGGSSGIIDSFTPINAEPLEPLIMQMIETPTVSLSLDEVNGLLGLLQDKNVDVKSMLDAVKDQFDISYQEDNGKITITDVGEDVHFQLAYKKLEDGSYDVGLQVVKDVGTEEKPDASQMATIWEGTLTKDEVNQLGLELPDVQQIPMGEIKKLINKNRLIAQPEDGTISAQEAVELVDALTKQLDKNIEELNALLDKTIRDAINDDPQILEKIFVLQEVIRDPDKIKQDLQNLKSALENIANKDPEAKIKTGLYKSRFGTADLVFQYKGSDGYLHTSLNTAVKLYGIDDLLKKKDIGWEDVTDFLNNGDYYVVRVIDRAMKLIKLPIEDITPPPSE